MSGLSLIELMVALVVGLIVVGAVLSFMLSSLRANTDFIRSTRLMQELRTNMNFVSDELRRAGYDERAMDYAFRPASFTNFSMFSRLQVVNPNAANGCVLYAYDRGTGGVQGTVDLANGEIRAIRRAVRTVNGVTVGVIEAAESAAGVTPSCTGNGPNYANYPPTCNAGTGWCALSDPRVVNITAFTIGDAGLVNLAATPSVSAMQIRRLGVEIRGELVNDGDSDVIRRGIRENIRIRSDCVRANPGSYSAPGNCTIAPTGV